MLRDEGCAVDISDSPAQAVQQIMKNTYKAVIIDSHAFGMPAEDAARVIKTVMPDIRVILVGFPDYGADAMSIRVPADLEAVRSVVHDLHQIGAISYI